MSSIRNNRRIELSDTLSFAIPYAPVPRKEPRFAKRGKWVPTVYNRYKQQVRQWLTYTSALHAERGRLPINEPISLSAVFVLPRKGKSSPTFPTKQNDGDLDNFVKALCDSANGIVWLDDRFIVAFHAPFEKRYARDGEAPRTIFQIRVLRGNTDA